jgi:abortive infection bacteriophage resistance protein
MHDIFTMTHNLHTVFHKELTKIYRLSRHFTTISNETKQNTTKPNVETVLNVPLLDRDVREQIRTLCE